MNANDRFELVASLYARRYGRLAPGKHDVGQCSMDPENVDIFRRFSLHGQLTEDALVQLERCSGLLHRIYRDADQTYDGSSNNGQANFSAELYEELSRFVKEMQK